jgi:hypothetical protein
MFQQPDSSKPKCQHNYEFIIILPQFPSHIDVKERNNKSWKKIHKQDIKDHNSTTMCTLSKLLYFHNYFSVFYLLCTPSIRHKNKLVVKEFPKKIQNLLNFQLSCLKHHLNFISAVLISPTLYLLNSLCSVYFIIDIIVPTPCAYPILLL